MLNIKVIVGSIREGRFADKPANWIVKKAQEKGLNVELIDLKDYPMPMFADAQVPASIKDGNYPDESVQRFAAKMNEADGFIMTVAEYNHGYTPVLKNALDHIYKEWVKKPVAFVGYGTVGGARAVQQLRNVVNWLQMVPVPTAVNISEFWNHVDENGVFKSEHFEKSADAMLDQLVWLANALKDAKAKDATAAV